MQSLKLSAETFSKIASILTEAEKINGCDMYETEASSAWDCKRWDCVVSCDCSNCRN